MTKEKSKLKIETPGTGKAKVREDFLAEGKTGQKKEETTSLLPWQDPDVNARVIKAFNLRLTEPDSLKLKYVVDNLVSDKSMHAFCVRIVMQEVERQLLDA